MLAKFLSDDARRQRRLVHIPMGRFGEPVGDRQRRAVPGQRRVELDDRSVADHRRRDHRGIRHAGVSELGDAVAVALGVPVTGMAVVHGGDVAAAYRVDVERRAGGVRQDPSGGTARLLHDRGERAARGCAGPASCRCRRCSPWPTARAVPMLVLEWIDRRREAATSGARSGPRRAARRRGPVVRPRGPPHHRQPRPAQRADATWAAFYASSRLLPLARLARDGRALPSPSIVALERLAGRWSASTTARATGAPARRPVGRQPTGRRAAGELADRPGGTRRAPRVRPGDDAPVRRLRRRRASPPTRRCTRSRPAGPTGWSCTRSPRWSCTPIKFGGGYVGAAARAPSTATHDRHPPGEAGRRVICSGHRRNTTERFRS